MPMSAYLFNCTRNEAFLCYERRVAAGAPVTSSPADEKRDWEIGKKTAVREVGLPDLCMRVMNCTDVGEKIGLAVMFYVADSMGLPVDGVNDQTVLSHAAEKRKELARRASYAATNNHLTPKRGSQPRTVGELITALQEAWQRLNGGL